MANYGSGDIAFILVGGYSLMGYLTDLTDEAEKFTEEDTRLGQTWTSESQTGMLQAGFGLKGFYDDSTGTVDAAFVGLSGADRVACYGLAGNTKGQHCRILAGALQSTYKRTPNIGKLTRVEAGFKVDGQVDDGKIVAALASRSAASNTRATSLDNSAASTNGGIVALQVTALSLGGYTNLACLLEHSTDNVTFATKQAMTVVTAAPAAEAIVLTGTINRYTAMAWSYNGAGSGPTHTSMMALARR